MKLTSLITVVYGLIIFFSGIYGFFMNNSPWALIFGVIVGVILMGNAYATYCNNFMGIYITIIVSIVLSVFGGIRLTRTLSVLPVGLIFVASVISLGFSVFALSYRKFIDE
jgi:uncharacterized membrane protein (UPF0136 family)